MEREYCLPHETPDKQNPSLIQALRQKFNARENNQNISVEMETFLPPPPPLPQFENQQNPPIHNSLDSFDEPSNEENIFHPPPPPAIIELRKIVANRITSLDMPASALEDFSLEQLITILQLLEKCTKAPKNPEKTPKKCCLIM